MSLATRWYPVVFNTHYWLLYWVFECARWQVSRKKIRNFATVTEYQMPHGFLCSYEQLISVWNFALKFQVVVQKMGSFFRGYFSTAPCSSNILGASTFDSEQWKSEVCFNVRKTTVSVRLLDDDEEERQMELKRAEIQAYRQSRNAMTDRREHDRKLRNSLKALQLKLYEQMQVSTSHTF